MQMVLGGLVRHSGAALACTDVPLCRGSLWPDAHPTVLIQALHRLNAVAVACLVLASSIVTLAARDAAGAAGAGAAWRRSSSASRSGWGFARCSRSSSWSPSRATWRWRPRSWRRWCSRCWRRVRRASPASRAWPGSARWSQLAKPRITGMVIITFAGGLWLAPGRIAGWRAIMTLVGTALLVAASNTFNMYLERDVDPLMDRTRDRPLPRAALSPETALAFGTLMACAAVPLVFLGGNLLTGILGLCRARQLRGRLHAAQAPLGDRALRRRRAGRAAAAHGMDGGHRPPRRAGAGAVLDPVPLADPTLPGDRHLSRGRLRARRLQGAAAGDLHPRHPRHHRALLHRPGGGDDRARAAAGGGTWLPAVRGAAGGGVHRLGGGRASAARRPTPGRGRCFSTRSST